MNPTCEELEVQLKEARAVIALLVGALQNAREILFCDADANGWSGLMKDLDGDLDAALTDPRVVALTTAAPQEGPA